MMQIAVTPVRSQLDIYATFHDTRPTMHQHFFIAIILSWIVLVSSNVQAEQQQTSATWINVVDNKQRPDDDHLRDRREKPQQFLTFSEVAAGMSVLDLFGGSGYYAELLAHAVTTQGHVLLLNNPAFHYFSKENLADRQLSKRLSQVQYDVQAWSSLQLENKKFDRAFVVLAFHDAFYSAPEDGWPTMDPVALLQQVAASLKDNGKLIVIDHHSVAGSKASSVKSLHRIEEEYAQQQIEAAGFTLEARASYLSNPHDNRQLMVFDPEIRGKTDRFVHRYTKAAVTN